MLILTEYLFSSAFPLWIVLLLAAVFLTYLVMQFSAWGILVLSLSYITSREKKQKSQESSFHQFGKLLI